MLLRFVFLASLLLSVVVYGRGETDAGREDATDPLTTEDYSLAFNGHVDEYVQVDIGSDSTLQQWFYRYQSGAIGAWIKPGQDLRGRNIIMEFTIKNHYVLFIENNSLMLAETGGDGTEAEGGWSIYSYKLDLTSPDWIYVVVSIPLLDEEPQDPRVHATGLDKPKTVQKLEYRVIGREQMMEGYEKTDVFVIGRGFRGSLVLLEMARFRSYQSAKSYCMEHHDSSDCYFPETLSELRNFTSQIFPETGSSIRWERNTIRPFLHSNIECKDFGVNIDIDPEGFDLATPQSRRERYGYRYYDEYRTITTYPVNLTLGDARMGCNFTWNGDDRMYTVRNSQLLDCGFTSTSLGNETLYQNTVYQHTHSASKKLMSISCRYEPRPVLREELTIAAYVFEEISFTVDHTYAPLKMSLEMFSDRLYSRKLQNPAKLGDVDELIYVEARVYGNSSDAALKVELEVESCRTHVTLNEHDTLQTKLIDNFQPTNPSVTFIPVLVTGFVTDSAVSEGSVRARKRFSFKAAQFKEYPNAVVYLSCVLSAEEATEPEKHATEPLEAEWPVTTEARGHDTHEERSTQAVRFVTKSAPATTWY